MVTAAARRIGGSSLEALYRLRNRPGPGLCRGVGDGFWTGGERLEDCAIERAILGEERPVVPQRAKVVATWRRYDTQLILFCCGSGGRSSFMVPTLLDAAQDFRGAGEGAAAVGDASSQARAEVYRH